MVAHNYPLTHEHYWAHDLQVIAAKLKLVTVDHLLASSVPIPTSTTITYADPFVLQAVAAFHAMKYGPAKPHIHHYNDAASIRLFYNPWVTQPAVPNTPLQPWTQTSPAGLGRMFPELYYAAQLYSNFDTAVYKTQPWVGEGRLLTAEELNYKYARWEVEYQITQAQLDALVQSLSAVFPGIHQWLRLGSRTLQCGVYHAVPAHGPTMVVYTAHAQNQLKEHKLQLAHDLTHVAQPTGRILDSGQPDIDDPQTVVPTMHDLKPLLHRNVTLSSTDDDEPGTSIHQITAFRLQLHRHPHPTGVYFPTDRYMYQPQPSAKFREAARLHRREKSHRNLEVATLHTRLSNDSEVDDEKPIQTITEAMQSMMVSPRTWQPLYRLLHGALYMGQSAIYHQRHNRHMHHFQPLTIYSPKCILRGCEYCDCTIQHELFDCPAVQPLWQMTHTLMRELGDTTTRVTNMYDFWKLLITRGTTASASMCHIPTDILVINLAALTIKAVWNAYVAKMKLYERWSDPLQIRQEHSRRIRQEYTNLLRAEVYQLPHHVATLDRRKRYRKQDKPGTRPWQLERELQLARRPRYDTQSLGRPTEALFLATWCKTHIAEVTLSFSGQKQLSVHSPAFP